MVKLPWRRAAVEVEHRPVPPVRPRMMVAEVQVIGVSASTVTLDIRPHGQVPSMKTVRPGDTLTLYLDLD